MTSHRRFFRHAPPDNPGTHVGVARGAGAVGGAVTGPRPFSVHSLPAHLWAVLDGVDLKGAKMRPWYQRE